MYRFPIGVMLEAFRTERSAAICRAAAMGVQGIQMFASRGEKPLEHLTAAERRALLCEVKSHGLVFSALCGDLGHGFGDKEKNAALIERSKRILDLAKELETDIVTTHIGVVPADKNHERYKIMQEACYQLASYADGMKAHFAIETGPEPSAALKEFLDSLGTKGVAVNLDPANLAMVVGDDPVQAVYNLKDYIVHTHAKDGRMLLRTNPEYIYRVVHPIPEDFGDKRYFEEVPFGTGSVDFDAYFCALEDVGYRGFLTIEREAEEDPDADLLTAKKYLDDVMKRN